jgi:outer membrane protein OmpA-like peptidoglycan-associated protein
VPALVAALAAPAAPSVVCSASPAEMKSGESSTITAVGTSAPGHALRYSYGSSAGSVNGSSTTALLSTAGVAAGTIVVTCNVADDLGQTASAETTVELEAAPLAAVAATSPLCGVSFARDTRRPARVDNEAKACLDDIALNLQRSPDAQLALVGDAAAGEPRRERLAAQRAVDTKAYLVSEKGIDAARILVFSGSGGEKTVSATLVPAGATFDSAQDRPVDEGVVKANTRRTGGGPQRRR